MIFRVIYWRWACLGSALQEGTRAASLCSSCHEAFGGAFVLHARDLHGLRKLSEVLLCDFGSLLFSGLACSRCLMKLAWT